MITAEPNSDPTNPSGSAIDDSSVDLPASGTGVRARRRRHERRLRLIRKTAFIASMVVLVVSIPLLGWIGYGRVFNTTSGRKVDPTLDPSEANYEATVEPTPTELLVQLDDDGKPVSVTLLVLGSEDKGGAVLFIPLGTMVEVPSFGLDRLGAAFELGGLPSLQQAAANVLGLSFDEMITVDADRLAELTEPVAPLVVDNPDAVESVSESGRVDVVFPAGPIELSADEVATYLATSSAGESDLARLVRQQFLWQSWLEAVSASGDPGAVPGELSTGLGRFIHGLAAGRVEYDTLPVEPVTGVSGDEVFQPDREAIEELVPVIVPFPTSANPGDRVRVRILNGTGTPGLAQSVTELLVPAGAEITVVGNADRFNYDKTQVVFYSRGEQDAADRMREALGVGEVVFSRVQNDAIDLTIVVGHDFISEYDIDTGNTGGDTTG